MAADAPPDERRQALVDKLAPIGQRHLLAFWDRLSPAERANLAAQIEAIDVDLFLKLRSEHRWQSETGGDSKSHWAALAARAESPPAMRLDGRGVHFTREAALNAGAAALAAGQVGMILVAGGLGTRLGFDRPKGMFPIGPLSGRSLFQVLLEQLLAVSRRYGKPIPLYVMTSPATDADTREYLAEHRNFGLPASDVHVFCQATMWAVDEQFNRILLESPSSLFLGPDGHGGMLAALEKSSGLADCRQRGLQHLFYAQIDNPLTEVCDEVLLGSHILAGSQMTTQVVKKREPRDRMGNVVSIDGRVQVIEYSDLPDEFTAQTNPDGSLKLWAGNLAVHVFDLEFLNRSARQADALPYHSANKKVRCLDERGQVVEPEGPNAIRFERFIFDLLPLAERALVVEADPFFAFAPVKNSDDEPTDNPATAKAAMVSLHRGMLRHSGVEVGTDVPIEINPLWASTIDEIRDKLSPGTFISQATYFAPDGPRTVI